MLDFSLIFILTELFTEETLVTEETIQAEENVEAEAAVKIQAAFRGMQARSKVKAMKDETKVTRHAITGVHVQTLGGATEVTLSPRELTREERKRALAGVTTASGRPKRVKVAVPTNILT